MDEREAREAELLTRIEKCRFVIDGLDNYGPYKAVLEDFYNTRKTIDDNWHLISDPQKLFELRVTKLATISILNIVANYKHDLEKAKQELSDLNPSDTHVAKDYDPN